ncbi:hypothetical protein LAV79_27010 [Peribacillus butanolivorans]
MFKRLVTLKKQKNTSLEKAVRQVLSDTVGISETASTSDIATHDMSNMIDVQAILTAMADMEAQRKEQEQQFAVRMQDILEKTTESLETELNQVKQYKKELMDSNRRIEAISRKNGGRNYLIENKVSIFFIV